MLADDVAVAGDGGNAQLLGQQVAEPGRVEVSAGADDAVLRQSADLPSHVRQDIHRVAGDDENCVRAVFN